MLPEPEDVFGQLSSAGPAGGQHIFRHPASSSSILLNCTEFKEIIYLMLKCLKQAALIFEKNQFRTDKRSYTSTSNSQIIMVSDQRDPEIQVYRSLKAEAQVDRDAEGFWHSNFQRV